MMKYSFFRIISITVLFILYGHVSAGASDVPRSRHPEPAARLVFEARWGDGEAQLGRSPDYWSPSFEYYFVRGDEVFIADETSKEVKYYKGGKYIRSYDYSFGASRMYGMVVIGDLMYWFFDQDGAVGVSIKDGTMKYSKGFPFSPNQNYFHVYQYGQLMIISENVLNKGSSIRMCLGAGLHEVTCPNFALPERRFEWSPYQYLAPDRIAFYYALRQDNTITPRIVRTDSGMHEIQGVVFPKEQVSYEMPGQYQITDAGVYYAVHTKLTAQIWFKPWWGG